MANPNFEVSTITTAGAALLAQATEGNKVIFSGCEANSTVYTLEQAKAVSSITGTRITDGIEVTGVTDARIFVRATFEPSAATGGEAKSLILFGRLSSQGENTRTPICVVSNSTSFYLPEYDQAAVTAFDCIFTIQYNVSSPVVVEQTSALECSLAEFRQLKDRVVTTHKDGENTVGDDQNIYGYKTFLSPVTIDEALFVTGNTHAGNLFPNNANCTIGFSSSRWGSFYCKSANFSDSLVVGETSYFSDVVPNENDTASLGSSVLKWSNVWASNVYATEGVAATDVTVSGDISFSGGSVSHSILPAVDKNGNIGSSEKRWKYVYADIGVFDGAVTVGSLLAADSIGSLGSLSVAKGVTFGNTLKVTGEASFDSTVSTSGTLMTYGGINLQRQNLFFGADGGSNYKMTYFNKGIDVYGHLTPGATGAYSLGSSSYKWSDVFASSLSGSASAIAEALCPANDSAYTISIGSVLIIIVRSYRAAGAGETTVVRGTAMSSSSWSIFPGSFLASGIDSSTSYTICFLHSNTSTALSGTYRLMSNLYFSKNSTSTAAYYYSAALAVRIA